MAYRDSHDQRYSATLYNVHVELDEVQVSIMVLNMARSQPDDGKGSAAQQTNTAVKRSSGPAHYANQHQIMVRPDDESEDEVVCLS